LRNKLPQFQKSWVNKRPFFYPTFLKNHISGIPEDDGSLDFIFKDYTDDYIREPIVNFGRAVGNEQWYLPIYQCRYCSAYINNATRTSSLP
jgi:hypothetical protein